LSFRFRRLRTRILVLFLGLVGLVQAVSYYAVETANLRNAGQQISESLETGARVFARLLDTRTRHLAESVRLLSSDFAFKKIVATRDRASILSALASYRQRSHADAIMVLSPDRQLLADTLHPGGAGISPELSGLLGTAENDENGEAVALVFIDRRVFQLVAVPLLAPDPIAWIVAGFLIDDRLAGDLKKLILADVSLLSRAPEGRWQSFASTLSEGLPAVLPERLSGTSWRPNKSFSLRLGEDAEYVSLMAPLAGNDATVLALLQQPLQEKLQPFHRLNEVLLGLALAALLFSLAGGVWIAHSVTRPVADLVQGVRRVERGEYGHVLAFPYRDEIGQLAGAFNRMSLGLEERDRVRDLLGKVVSPAIAQELLSKEVYLGGEEREVTVLFSDVRGFTTLGESLSPKALLDLLNVYLTEMSAIVEKHGGVVDKYIGDAVMALFGAPLNHEDDADRALLAALEMDEALARLNAEFVRGGLPKLDIGIGVNTGLVVAGNMGSHHRLNYTVIGDEVNLAARLESLTKEEAYAARIIVSGATLRKARGSYETRPLGQVVVKGKTQATEIFALNCVSFMMEPPSP
jgi:adenylate cyclase